jgi:hypothetical protein
MDVGKPSRPYMDFDFGMHVSARCLSSARTTGHPAMRLSFPFNLAPVQTEALIKFDRNCQICFGMEIGQRLRQEPGRSCNRNHSGWTDPGNTLLLGTNPNPVGKRGQQGYKLTKV